MDDVGDVNDASSQISPDCVAKTITMTYPLLKKITNGANDSHQGESGSDVLRIVSSLTGFHDAVSKQGVRVSSIEPVESDGAKLELPENFGEVVKGVYRSAFPQTWNFSALNSLGLKTIM